jgi:hypothetical protein
MCWNERVSINTFLFSVSVLFLIYINNTYLPPDKKIKEFDNPYAYFFMMSFVTMQLYEYLLWKYLNNGMINQIVSTLSLLLLSIQPIASLTLLNNINLRNKLIGLYSIPTLIYILYQLKITNVHTTISKLGHLKWKWVSQSKMVSLLTYTYYLFFLYLSLFINKQYYGIIITMPLFLVMYYYYYNDGSAGSLWCFSVNSVMFYYLIQIIYNFSMNLTIF